MSNIENNPPNFTSDPVIEGDATEGEAYSGTIADDATDPDSDPLSFSKVSGPAWLAVASDGTLSGTPGTADIGLNSWTVQVSDGNGGKDTATVQITVVAATVHVADLDGASELDNKNRWNAKVTITVVNANGNSISDANIITKWSSGTRGSNSCVTNNSGQCSVTKKNIKIDNSSATLAVTSVEHASYIYDSDSNNDPDGDSNGTSIIINKP